MRKIYPSNYEQDFSGIYDYESERLQKEDAAIRSLSSSVPPEAIKKDPKFKYAMTVIAVLFSIYYFSTKPK